MKKKYNPFKMLGSYIGLIILGGWKFWVNTKGDFSLLFSDNPLAQNILINILFLSITGFLLGWGIEVLLRKYKLFGLK